MRYTVELTDPGLITAEADRAEITVTGALCLHKSGAVIAAWNHRVWRTLGNADEPALTPQRTPQPERVRRVPRILPDTSAVTDRDAAILQRLAELDDPST